MGEARSRELDVPATPPDRPRVVDEAYEVLGTYGWQLFGAAAVGVFVWGLALSLDAVLPLAWLAFYLIGLAFLFFSPVTREARLARDVLRRWDDLRVQRALRASGVRQDPRFEVAEAMADRIVRHPDVDVDIRSVCKALLERLGLLLTDLRRLEWLGKAVALDEGSRTRSISDLQDVLEARVGSVISEIAELHRTVVLRDAVATRRALESVEELLRELEAEREVEELLAEAERT